MTPEEQDAAWCDLKWFTAFERKWRLWCTIWFIVGVVVGTTATIFGFLAGLAI